MKKKISNNVKENKRKKLYICHTYYHLLISVIKALKDQMNDSYLLLATSWDSADLTNDDECIKNLENNHVFKEIYIEDFQKEKKQKILNSHFKWFQKNQYLKNMTKSYPIFEEFDELYLFNDLKPVARLINKKKIKYNLLEDGTDCFKNNKNIIKSKWSLKKIVKYMLGMRDLGESKNIKSIEVNDKTGVFLNHSNIVEIPKKELFKTLTNEEKNVILNIFLHNVNLFQYCGYSLLITQPLFESSILSSETEQLKIYETILNDYLDDDKILIKVHPRDHVDYTKFKDRCNILKDKFPLEICTFFQNLKFEKIVTISSTSINILDNCQEKIFLGWDWLEQEKERIRYEKK